ncbi:hypothetical protein PVAP13_8KG082000 [Panicum virgatum]|uniref:PGG domain-containing protein n=1 Tax=Panicum virgatum TaxID=38727 RepID=A0A8T0PGJ3_PANVG|nr:hypothetical protein PVAP13_8KG082000 [Panicum virgatum]
MVDLLLEWRPALAGEVDSDGGTPLHFASSDGDRAVVRAILRAGPPGMVYKKDYLGGLSALHVAARMGHRRVVEDMLEAYPDAAELRGGDGGTFMHAAAREKRSKVVSLAIGKTKLRGLLDAQDRDGNTPLHLAVAAGAPAVVEALLRKGKVRTDVLNNDGRPPLDLATGSTSFFTMVSLVVTLAAFRAKLRPHRQDHAKPWSGGDVGKWIDKMSDSLSVVAVLIATAAFAAGFNLPGGYGDNNGKANLSGSPVFKIFLVLDTVAVAASVTAVILLVYGKGSRSTGSWKSFAAALLCMWVALISLLLGYYMALSSVTNTRAVYRVGLIVIYVGVSVLQLCIENWVGPSSSSCTVWRFFLVHQLRRSKGRRAVKRQFPLAGASVLSFYAYQVITFVAFIIFGFFLEWKGKTGTSPAQAPSPL